MKTLKKSIEDYNTDAQELHHQLKAYMSGYPFETAYHQMGELINDYDFKAAQEICEKIIDELTG